MSGASGSFIPAFFKDSAEILAGQTKEIHDIDLSESNSILYIITATNSNQTKTKQLQVSFIRDSDLKWNIFGKSGKLAIEILPVETLGQLLFNIKNNESDTITIDFAYAPQGPQ